MLQVMLAERFALVVHNDKKPVQAWALTAGKPLALKQSDGSGASGCKTEAPSGQGSGDAPPQPAVQTASIVCHNITMADFAAHMSDMQGAWNFIGDNLVADQTSLEGGWDFSLKYSRRNGGI